MGQQNEGEQLIRVLIKEHDDNKVLEALRREKLKGSKDVGEQGFPQMREITEKLNRLQKTILKKNVFNEKNQISKANKDKYEQLNNLNHQLKTVLAKLPNRNSKPMKEMQSRVVNLYNNSVITLNNQDKLNKKLHTLELQDEIITSQIKSAESQTNNASLELQRIKAEREINFKRLQRLQACYYL